MAATESNFDCGWRPYVWRGKSARRRGDVNNVGDEERKEKAPDQQSNKPDLRMNVFISKDSTSQLATCVLFEQWGEENANLYKYIDYTWRSALFNRQVFAFSDKTGKNCLVFHSGLQRRGDGEFIYLVLVPNDDKTKTQKWRIASAPTADWSFKIAGDLLQYVDGIRERLPNRCRFYNDPAELLFDTQCLINVDWVKSIDSCRQRIQQEIVNCLLRHDQRTSPPGHDIESHLPPESPANSANQRLNFAKEQLKARNYTIPEALEMRALFQTSFATSERIVKANPYFVVPQGFVDSKKGECRLELLLPIFVSIDSNVSSSGMSGEANKIRLCFALALQREESYNGYKAMSILTPDMAYTNARLVGLVNSAWLLAAAWPDIYSSPLLMRPTPARHTHRGMYRGGTAGMPIIRSDSAPLLDEQYHNQYVSRSGMTRVSASSMKSAPPRFPRGGAGPPGLVPPESIPRPIAPPGVEALPPRDDVTKRSLFVRNIPADWNEETIKEKFLQIGPVNRITMLPNRNKDSDLQLCLIEMESQRVAVNAQNELNDDETEDGLKVQPQRGRPSRSLSFQRAMSAENVLPGDGASASTNWRSRMPAAASAASVLPMSKLTLRIDNLQPQQTARTLLELLHLADISDSDIDWINVYHPDNVAFVRFKTLRDVQRAYETFMSKTQLEYTCRVVKNQPFSGDESYWKFSGSGERLEPVLSEQLERARYGETFYENVHDEQNSPRITRYDGSVASRFSPETQSAAPLIRVQISSWRRPRRWANSRLKRSGTLGHAQSSPLTLPPGPMTMAREQATNPVSVPPRIPGSGSASGAPSLATIPDSEANESKEQPKRTFLNPNARAFNPQTAPRNSRPGRRGDSRSQAAPSGSALEDDDVHVGGTFVPHHDPVDIGRGTPVWNDLERKFGRVRGWDISEILEWPDEVPTPSIPHRSREVWFVGLPGQIDKLSESGFIGKYADYGLGKGRKYTFWNSPVEAQSAFGDSDLQARLDFVFCDVYLSRPQSDELREHNWVRIAAPKSGGCVATIVPKYIFHTSHRRVGH